MAAESSHGLVRSGATIATVVETQVGATLELPTRTGGWMLNEFMAQVNRSVAVAAESIGGNFRLRSPSGDVSPAPEPSRFPCFESGSFLGSVADHAPCPLFKYPIDLLGAGKADIDFLATNGVASTNAPVWSVGLHFAPAIVVPSRPQHCNVVRATQAAVARTQVGTITLSENATEIVGIMGVLSQDGVLVTAEELVGFFDLESEDIDIVPSQWLFNTTFGAGIGATIHGGMQSAPNPHWVSIPVPGGARIDAFVTLTVAVTNPADVEIFIFYR